MTDVLYDDIKQENTTEYTLEDAVSIVANIIEDWKRNYYDVQATSQLFYKGLKALTLERTIKEELDKDIANLFSFGDKFRISLDYISSTIYISEENNGLLDSKQIWATKVVVSNQIFTNAIALQNKEKQ